MAFELRPLSMGELLDRAFSIYRRSATLFLGIMAVPTVFALGLGLVVTILTDRPGFNGRPLEPGQVPELPSLAVVLWLVVGYFAFTILYGTTYLLALGASTMAVSDAYVDRPTSVGDAFTRVRPRTGRLLLVSLLIFLRLFLVFIGIMAVAGVLAALLWLVPALGGLLLALGMLIAFVVVVFLSLRYVLAVPITVLEQSRATEAITRSAMLTKGSYGRIFLLFICSMVLTYAALAIFQAPFTFGAALAGPGTPTAFWLTITGVVSGSVGTLLASPVLIIGIAVLYYDLRVRKEALDVQLMMQAFDAADTAAAPAPGAPALPPIPGA